MKNINMKNNNKDFCASDDARPKIEQIEVDHLFDNFWQIYPNKKDRARAKKRWEKLKQSERLLILEKLKEQVIRDKQYSGDPAYVPLPSTYLNGRRWEDEICVGTTQSSSVRAPLREEPKSTVGWYGGKDPARV